MLYQITWNMFPEKKMDCYKVFSQMTPDDDVKDAGEDIKIVGRWHSVGGGSGNARQNNRTMKIFHANDSMAMCGYKSEPKGHQGQSSGACVTGAFTVTATRYQ